MTISEAHVPPPVGRCCVTPNERELFDEVVKVFHPSQLHQLCPPGNHEHSRNQLLVNLARWAKKLKEEAYATGYKAGYKVSKENTAMA